MQAARSKRRSAVLRATATTTRLIPRREGGFAVAQVALLGLILIMIVTVVALRAATSANDTYFDRGWEESLFVAEAGIGAALYEIDVDQAYATVAAGTDLSTKDKVIATAEALVADDPGNAVGTPDGDFVIVRAVDDEMVYVVGASPSWDALRREVRVVSARAGNYGWTPEYGFLVGGELKVEAKKKDKDVEMLGAYQAVHANGMLELKDKNENDVWGCLTAYGYGAPGQEFSNNGTPDCPAQPNVLAAGPIEIPEINPMNLHYLAQYEVCPDGINRYGPAARDVPPGKVASAVGSPCTGDAVVIDLLLKDSDEGDKRVEFKGETVEGVYFLYGRSAKMKKDKVDQTFHFTIIATKPYNVLDCDHVLPGGEKIDKEQYGDIEIDAHGDVFPHPDGLGYLVVTAGDVKMKTKHKKDGEIHGAVFSHEQIKLESEDINMDESEPKGGFQGTAVAESACDTKDSKQKKRSELKKGDILWDGSFRSHDFGDINGLSVAELREMT